ncbi:MAG: hypothetical protein DWQ31_19290 [Planctomycetota bacterium]|nr:MAG: hypothetical protein DWQ31_19290 [Planctomycetota bacterium]REK30170.1 MAG: hypothetical protein DWQ42_01965 [Planctomycetota bacterium]REK43303.1 MAG: hypothetical protein DWQ46_11830 [Planctomycetota bacterium]
MAYLLVLPVAWQLGGSTAAATAGVASLLCLGGVFSAFTLSELFGTSLPAHVSLGMSMLPRMMIPLVIGSALHFSHPQLANHGLLVYVAAFYFVMLAAEVGVTLPVNLGPTSAGPSAAGPIDTDLGPSLARR